MTKINDLPSIVTPDGGYYGGCILVTNGYDENGDYVTGQINSSKIIDDYINDNIVWGSYITDDDQLLWGYTGNDGQYRSLHGVSLLSTISVFADYISDSGYLDDYISSRIDSYVLNGYLDSYIGSSIGSYVYDMPQTYFSSGIDGIVVKNGSGLEYIATSSFTDAIYYAIYYDGPYPHSLSDDTPIAGMDAYSRLASITLGDIVSYVKAHL